MSPPAPGSSILRPSGVLGLLPTAAGAIADANGQCNPCCGGTCRRVFRCISGVEDLDASFVVGQPPPAPGNGTTHFAFRDAQGGCQQYSINSFPSGSRCVGVPTVAPATFYPARSAQEACAICEIGAPSVTLTVTGVTGSTCQEIADSNPPPSSTLDKESQGVTGTFSASFQFGVEDWTIGSNIDFFSVSFGVGQRLPVSSGFTFRQYEKALQYPECEQLKAAFTPTEIEVQAAIVWDQSTNLQPRVVVSVIDARLGEVGNPDNWIDPFRLFWSDQTPLWNRSSATVANNRMGTTQFDAIGEARLVYGGAATLSIP